jgi:hypothetical protein
MDHDTTDTDRETETPEDDAAWLAAALDREEHDAGARW